MVESFLLGVSYNSWKETCDMFLSPANNYSVRRSFSMYLQDYPFTQITPQDKEVIESEEFYEQYISTGAILFNDSVLFCTQNFITKNSGSFRDSQLLSPFMFLLQQVIGIEIQKRYQENRKNNLNLIAYYSGNLESHKILYKNEYKEFTKWNNYYAEDHPFFIKTDLSDYFANINLNRLMELVNKKCNKGFTPLQQKTIVDVFRYCGNGKFPLVQNSVSSSFLATIVYLDDIDIELGKFIDGLPDIEDYKLVRYVDDLYIWLKPKNNCNLNYAYNEIRSDYSSLLHKQGLTLNTSKTGLHRCEEISDQLKKTIYDDVINAQENAIDEYVEDTNWTNNIKSFINNLLFAQLNDELNKESFEKIIMECFKPDRMIEFTGEEVLKYIIYDNNVYLQDLEIVDNLASLIKRSGVSFIYLSPQLLTAMILNTANSQNKNEAIKTLLNQLFSRNRNRLINSYDIMIIIQYLLHTHFRHHDLKEKILKENANDLYDYITKYCYGNFFKDFKKQNKDKQIKIINGDWKAYYLFFNYRIEKDRQSLMEAYAYFKTYFDRMTALIAAYVSGEPLNVKGYYEEDKLCNVYKNLLAKDERKLIKKANKLRNKNPLVHSSSELLGQTNWARNIMDMIFKLNNLIENGIAQIEK